MIKIYGEPRLVIYDKLRQYPPIRLDGNGEAVAKDNPFVQRAILVYKHEIIDEAEDKSKEINNENTDVNETVYNCKKCDFSTASRGELLLHYKNEHPKKGG